MNGSGYPSIKALVLEYAHSRGGKVDYASLTEQVKKHFPDSKWQRTHWAWYRSQILHGRFRHFFSDDELAAISGTKANNATNPKASVTPFTAPAQQLIAIQVTEEMFEAVKHAVAAARVYEKTTQGRRRLGMTGEVGEVLCCQLLGLKLCADPRSQGFDAVDTDGKLVQIKARRSESDGLPRDVGRLSTFSLHKFDYALLVLLDVEYRIVEIWRAEHGDIADLIKKQKRRNPSLSAFKRKARLIWPTA